MVGAEAKDKDMTEPANSMTLMDAINTRRSVRAFGPQKVEKAVINSLLAAAVRAPTARHEEPWTFAIVQDVALLQRLSDRAKSMMTEEAHRAHHDDGGHSRDVLSRPGFNIFYNANTLIAICAKSPGPFAFADCWLAAENLMLAACAFGLGSCVIGSAIPVLNNDEIKLELGISTEISVVAPIIVGVPVDTGLQSARQTPIILGWK